MNKSKTGKKLLSLLLSVLMCLSFVPTVAFATEEESGNDGYVANETADLTISNEDELFAFAEEVNTNGNTFSGKTVMLANDITLTKEWTCVGVSVVKSFKGTFDGNGHKIIGMKVKGTYQGYGYGFFGTVISAAIKNVTFENAEVTGAYSNIVGIVAGYSYGSSVFENVHVTNSSIYAFGKVGGIVGYAEDKGATTTFKSCSVTDTTLHGGYNMAAFCGLVQGKCNVSGSYLKGNNIIIDENAQGFGALTVLDTTVICDGSVATCAGNGTVIKGQYLPNGGYYWSAYSDLYNHYGDSSHDCTLTDGKLLANSEVVNDAPVAIGDVKYSDLQAAFDAAKTGDTVTLLSDITLTEQVNVTKALNGLTLDGNGKTITCATTDDPFKSGGSALYFGNADSKLYCTGIKIKDLNMVGTARFAIFLCGGTTTEFTNVNISGNYYIAVNLYGTHGATMNNCKISNSTVGTDKYISGVWSNVASQNPLTLNNTTVDVIAINTYTTANTLAPKILINEGSKAEIHTFDDGSVSGDKFLCVNKESKGEYSVKEFVKATSEWVDATVAEVGGVKYATLAAAIAAANDGDTVTLLSNCSGNGIQVPADKYPAGLTIDFAGYSYTIGGVLVGSSGTASNGFQLLKGNKITMKNGSIYGDKSVAGDDKTDWSGAPAILIQNYSDLTLDGMTVAGGEETAYTLSNNNGDTVIKDSKIIAGKAKGTIYTPCAFDVCRFSSYPSVSVTVTGNSVINGNVEISGAVGAGQSRQLNIEGGTFTGSFKISENVPANIAISGGTFANDVSEYVVEGCNISKDEKTGTYTVDIGNNIAKVNDSYYSDIDGALEALAAEGGTFTLLNDCTYSKATLTLLKDATINLNGKTLTLDKNINAGKYDTEVKLTVKNGKMIANTYYAISVPYVSSLLLENVEIEGKTGAVTGAGAFTVNGGKLTGESYGLSASNKDVTINSGEINKLSLSGSVKLILGENGADYTKAKVGELIVYSDKVTVDFNSGIVGTVTTTYSPTINTTDNAYFENKFVKGIPAGKTLTPIEKDGKTYYRLTDLAEADAAATVIAADGTRALYDDASVAAAAVKAGGTLKLNKNHNGDTLRLRLDAGSVTVDLNGYTVTNSNGPALYVVINGDYDATEPYKITVKNGNLISANSVALRADSTNNVSDVITEDVTMTSADGQTAVDLQDSARLVFEDEAAVTKLVGNGYTVTIDGTSYVYGVNGGLNYAAKALPASGGTVKLLNDYTGSQNLNYTEGTGKPVVLDLNGKTYNYTYTYGEYALKFSTPNSNLTVKNGTIISAAKYYAVYAFANVKYPTSTANDLKLTLDGVTLEATVGNGLGINGYLTGNVTTIKNSKIIAKDTGVYYPAVGTLNIENSDITGDILGIAVKGGTVNISGDKTKVSANSEEKEPTDYYAGGDGSITAEGYALYLEGGYGDRDIIINVSGGTFTSKGDAVKKYIKDGDTSTNARAITVSGGTFSSTVPNEYCAEGYVSSKNTDGTYSVKRGSYVAEVNGVKYESLEAAYAAAENNATITLLADCESGRINLETKSVKVVLNGYTLTSTAAYGVMFCAKNGNTITVDGTAEGSKLVGTVMITGETYGHIVLNGGTYENAKYCPLYVNGAVSKDDSTVTVTNATLKSLGGNSDQDMGVAAYLAGYAVYKFENCTITAPVTGIEIRAGKLDLINCNVTGGNGTIETNANGNGTTVKNAALAISQHNTLKNIEVNISGGTFTGTATVYQTNVQGTGSNGVKINITSGTFNGTVKADTANVMSISGGTFDNAVDSAYCAAGYVPTKNADGTYGVTKDIAQYEVSLTLEDSIDVNMYVKLPVGTAADIVNKYSVKVKFNGVETEYKLIKTSSDSTYDYYKIVIASAFSYEMTKPIDVTVYYDGAIVKYVEGYSVQKYLIDSYNDETQEKYKELYKAALDYGANAQLFFNGRTYEGKKYETDVGNLANATVNPNNEIVAIPEDYVKKSKAEGSVSGIVADKTGVSLILGSEVSIKYYLKTTEKMTLEQFKNMYNFTCEKEITVSDNGDGYFVITVAHIKSYELSKAYTLEITNGDEMFSLTYSALDYAYGARNDADGLGMLCRALYAYSQAADAIWN